MCDAKIGDYDLENDIHTGHETAPTKERELAENEVKFSVVIDEGLNFNVSPRQDVGH
jgi:hypothetical protein